MATGALAIKLRCASWQQLATIYKRDLSHGTMFLKASNPPPIGTSVRIDLTLPSGSVIALSGTVWQHVSDSQRGSGVELKLAPIPTGSIWLIESALASEAKRVSGAPSSASQTGQLAALSSTGSLPVLSSGTPTPIGPTASGPVMSTGEGQDIAAAEVDLIRALVAEAESLKKLNPFLVLGLGYEASDADVRAAFAELTKRYHPDRFARYQSSELRQVAAEIFILIRDAYRRLGDEAGRHAALAALGKAHQRTIQVPVVKKNATPAHGMSAIPVIKDVPPNPHNAPTLAGRESSKAVTQRMPDLDPAQTPSTNMQVARTGQPRPSTDKPVGAIRGAVDQSRTTGSANIIKRAPTPTPTPTPVITPTPAPAPAAAPTPPPRPVIEATDGNALEELLDAGRLEEALAGYKLLSKKHPQDRSLRAGIELCEGLHALGQRDRLEAAQRFETALEIDPSNERAARELADMRRQATNERKGLLSRLMGKKE